MDCLDVKRAILCKVECVCIQLELGNVSYHGFIFIYSVGKVFFTPALHYIQLAECLAVFVRMVTEFPTTCTCYKCIVQKREQHYQR